MVLQKKDIQIALLAADDYVSFFEYLRAVRMHEGLTGADTVSRLQEQIAALRAELPLVMFSTDRPFGDMRPVPWRDLSEAEIATPDDAIAGPPFYYFTLPDSPEAAEALAAFCRGNDCDNIFD